ncbi:hypothetical protein B0T25DRAFT_538273 [Lasiosphaeria hispida]|uniref:Uncharacterized protein n=1 Tax=Lasiosphaeria hispida TaxID=260671 RepID=A0AAJ0MFW0_9PEZI|nr:hypothetical protein B0T25DRAFT_538273 [Lasiosphaeria hispida]
MDDAARLVSDLHGRLAELDGKVSAYQRDMLAQFHRHMADCLRQYPDHVSNEVSRVITESMSRYSTLVPTRRDGSQSPPSDISDADLRAWDGRKSPPPILYHTSGIPKEGPRSPHQREKEFQGLFTPSYLPLLDSSYNSHPSPPVSLLPLPAPPSPRPALEPVKKVEEPKEPVVTVVGEVRPGSVRRPTDRSFSSVESSGSETKVRRSALRRASSSTKSSSPRRVRFDFEGEEVFPSTSPRASPTILVLAAGAGAQLPDHVALAIADTSAILDEDSESPVYTGGISLLDVVGEEDSFPRPRKVSSTQALQALSRSPLDAGTEWTVVNPESEEAKMNASLLGAAADKTRTLIRPEPEVLIRPEDATANNHRIDELLGSPIEELERHDDSDDSDEEFLSMRPKLTKTSPSPVTRSPVVASGAKFQSLRDPTWSHTLLIPEPEEGAPEEDDPLFDFEGEGSRAASPLGSQPHKYLSDDEVENGDEDATPVAEQYSGEGAINVPTPLLELDQEQDQQGEAQEGTPAATAPAPAPAQPPVSPSAVLYGHSIGSYKGHAMRINPMINSKLYDEIAGMTDVPSFVGSIDGRTGVDSVDPGSYHATMARGNVGSFSGAHFHHPVGTPRSFTERFAMEEALERRAQATMHIHGHGQSQT